MASPPTSPNNALEKLLSCSICLDPFNDPVTTACGHSYCKDCLRCNFRYNDRICPLCKTHLITPPEVNIVLRDIVQQLKNAPYTGAPGEVACDVCTGNKMKAEKSCLVCLASYCSVHLQPHGSTGRLSGHKLVEPVENLDARACLAHGRPLELYSRKKQACICVRCVGDGQEEVVSIEDERDKKKAQLENTKTELRQKIAERKTKVDEINTALQSCKDQMDNEWWDIEAVFNAVVAIVEEAHARAVQPINERRQVLEKEAKHLKEELEKEIGKLNTTISELEDISGLDDHILFLQRYPSPDDQEDTKDWTDVQLDTSLSFGTMRKTTMKLMETIQRELEKLVSIEMNRVLKFTEDVTLDPDTAHKHLVVSCNGKEVKDGGKDQNVPDHPGRFDMFGSVLGLNCLESGRAYWEVEVKDKTGWDLGVARGGAERRGKLNLDPDNGYWATTQYEDNKYAALTVPRLRLNLTEKPEKVGVFVDYEEGLVSFYDVTARSHIYSFSECSFQGRLHPYFSPHTKQDGKNAAPLVISDRDGDGVDQDIYEE